MPQQLPLLMNSRPLRLLPLRAALAAGAPPALEEAIIARLRALPQTAL